MKIRINKLPKIRRGISLSSTHHSIIKGMAESCGAVNQTPPREGDPNISLLLEAIAEGRLQLFDGENMITPDRDLSKRLYKQLDDDRKNNAFRVKTPMLSRRELKVFSRS